ncbi:MAG: phosphoserine phosphatase SerB [Gammaproteobacteria bacterium]|nr:phosphoserine phosphatase SerB [Gammaproteobacteria bacterium]
MPTLILQGSNLNNAMAQSVAQQLQASIVDQNSTFYRLQTPTNIETNALAEIRPSTEFDINVLPEGFQPESVRLLVTDMDSTLINIECIDEIADFLGIKEKISVITEAAMNGEIDFETSLTRRVELLKGLDVGALERVYNERLELNPGAERMIAGLNAKGIKVALVSGGFTFFTDRLKDRLKLDFTQANVLGIEGGLLTGQVAGDIVGAEAKLTFLLKLCREMNIDPSQAVAMGDGANDLKMMASAGLSVAYHAKPSVQAKAHTSLNVCGLEGVLGLLGIDNS